MLEMKKTGNYRSYLTIRGILGSLFSAPGDKELVKITLHHVNAYEKIINMLEERRRAHPAHDVDIIDEIFKIAGHKMQLTCGEIKDGVEIEIAEGDFKGKRRRKDHKLDDKMSKYFVCICCGSGLFIPNDTPCTILLKEES